MSKIYLFRGKPATGKTKLTDFLGKELRLPVLRKDDIYNELSAKFEDHALKNELSYTILTKLIRRSIENGCDFLVDIGLSHNPYFLQFLEKIDLRDASLYQFLCTCGDDAVWLSRIEERVQRPAPNQFYKSGVEAKAYFGRYDISPLPGETVLDSALPFEEVLQKIRDTIRAR